MLEEAFTTGREGNWKTSTRDVLVKMTWIGMLDRLEIDDPKVGRM
jgi:hypothetical protein